MISIENCIHGCLYEVDARNFSFGVFNKDERGFIGIRHKFGTKFLDLELYWHANETYGTVIPIKYICDCPYMDISVHNSDLYKWILNKIFTIKKGYYPI